MCNLLNGWMKNKLVDVAMDGWKNKWMHEKDWWYNGQISG